jgi:heterodisulfide reductase subunit C2
MEGFLDDLRDPGVNACYQCGTCMNSCPTAKFDKKYRPRIFVIKAGTGREQDVIKSDELWSCTTCYSCQERCPRGIKVTEMIRAMQSEAARQGRAPEKFAKTADVLRKLGLTAELVGFVKKQREKLGLNAPPKVCVDAVKKIFDETGINELFEKENWKKKGKGEAKGDRS